MKRKFMVILMIAALVFSVVGCGNGSAQGSGDKEKIVLGIWDENQKDALQIVVDEFNAQSDTVEASIELTPWSNYWTKLDAAANAGEAADVFWMNVYLPKYVAGDVVLSLDEYIAKDKVDMNGYVEAVRKMYNYENNQYAMPKGMDSVVVVYNKAIFDKYDVAYPEEGWSWDDMKVVAGQLRDKMTEADSGEYPILMELDAQPSHFNFIHQTGGMVISEDYKTCGYNKPETVEAYQNVVDLFDENLLAPYTVLSETKGTDLFLSQKGAILFAGSWKAKVFDESSIAQDGNIGMITMPKQSVSNATVIGGLGYSIYKHTDHPDAAWELVKFLTGERGNQVQAEHGIDIPAMISTQKYYKANFTNIDPQVYFDAAKNSVPFPAGPSLTKWFGPVNDNAARIFAGEITAEEGCANIYTEMQKIIDEE